MLPAFDLDDVAKLAAAIVIALYALGFLTIHIYLLRFGVVQSELLRARFIQVGLLVLLPVAVSLVHAYFLIVALLRRVHRRPARRRQHLLAGLFFLLPPLEFTALFWLAWRQQWLPISPLEGVRWAIFLYVLALLPLAAVLLVESAHHRVIALQYADDDDRRTVGVVARMVTTVAAIAAAAPYVGFVAWVVFPRVPPQLGGGAPLPARLVFAPTAVDQARQLGLDVSAASLVSPKLEIIWEEAGWYLIRWQTPTGGNETVRLASDLAPAVLIELGPGDQGSPDPAASPQAATPAP